MRSLVSQGSGVSGTGPDTEDEEGGCVTGGPRRDIGWDGPCHLQLFYVGVGRMGRQSRPKYKGLKDLWKLIVLGVNEEV